MEPVLHRLGDITIQRVGKKKAESSEKVTNNEDESSEQIPISVVKNADELLQGVKRCASSAADTLQKKIKPDNFPENISKCDELSDELSEHNNSDKEISDYETDVDSELESDYESYTKSECPLRDVDNLSILQKPSIHSKIRKLEEPFPLPDTKIRPSKDDFQDSNGESENESFFEKLVEQAEVATTSTSTPDSTPPKNTSEGQDEDYAIDIKEKLKEMDEISFGAVKKDDASKKANDLIENEVVITSRKAGTEDEVLSAAKGMLRKNIREVMDETKLDEATLAAQRLEAERLRRVQEQQRVLREYQRQAAQERAQQRAAALLQTNTFSKAGIPGTSQTRIGNTVLVKLPNGQTKQLPKSQRPPFEFEPDMSSSPSVPVDVSMKLKPQSRNVPKLGSHLTPSVSIAPVGRKQLLSTSTKPHSESESETEDKKPPLLQDLKHRTKEGVQTIDISSDDDCIVVSDPEVDQDTESEQDDPSNSGMHTNDEFNQPDELGRVLVNVAHAEDEPDVFVAPQIARVIKPHQIGGVRFLYDNLIESINRFASSTGFGCILAHSMGLGKTLQIVTFSDIFLRYTPAKTVLCIMPINTLQNWMAEFNMWLPKAGATPNSLCSFGEVRPRNFDIFVLNDSHKTLLARAKVIREWRSNGGVLMIGYEQYRLLSMRKTPKSRKKSNIALDPRYEDDKNKILFDEVHQALVHPGPDLVICDEGHRIKNSHASISQALKQMRTKRRVVLTGYPLQNNLMEYWCMVDFVRPNYLGTKTEFCNMFERPIMNGQCIDSTETDIKLMRYRAHVLHSLLVGFVQRRSHKVLHSTLPQKEEYVLLVRMTPFQRKLYDKFMDEVVRKQSVPNPLKAFAVCCKIWNHPDVLYNFLNKKAGGEAVDIDLEEVANTIPGNIASNMADVGKAKQVASKSRKMPSRGKNCKPAASITPYSTNNDSLSMTSEANNSTEVSTSMLKLNSFTTFGNTVANDMSSDNSHVQAKASGELKANPEEPAISRPYYDSHFDQNAQFPSTFPSSANVKNFKFPMSNSNECTPNPDRNFASIDDQQSSAFRNLANLPSGISLTPVRNNQSAIPTNICPKDEPQNVASNILPNSQVNLKQIEKIDNKGGLLQLDTTSQHNALPSSQNNPQFNANSNSTNSNQSCTKSEDLKTNIPAQLISPKSENSNDSKPKINIISHIKLPPTFSSPSPEKKITIISDIKIETKKEEEDDTDISKQDLKTDNIFKSELNCDNTQKDYKVPQTPEGAKLNSIGTFANTKEDAGIPYDWAVNLLKDYVPGKIENSAKMQILFCIIRESIELGDRLLVFSQSLITLDLIEQFLQSNNVPGETVQWSKNVNYYRLDGSTHALEREKLINEFNSNSKIYVFLVSTRAGSLGINLIGANRVVVLDASWNPCHDTQAVCRVYRYGQKKPCFVYRLVVDNCLEKKIYDRQVSKQGMSDRVVDECNPDAHLTMKDVSTLCFDDKKDETEEKDLAEVKNNYIDIVLQKVLDLHGKMLSKEPFQHESLLVDRKEKQLSRLEKIQAKKGYEREKQASRAPMYMPGLGRGHRPIASVRPMQQGERPNRWIPAEHWQRQGMTAQEMTLPLDVVIPTNQPEKGNIVLRAGQKVLVLKSPKGVYMQLESGKIVAIKTALKMKSKSEENSSDPKKPVKQMLLPPNIKNTSLLSPMVPMAQKKPIRPFQTGIIHGSDTGLSPVKLNPQNIKQHTSSNPNQKIPNFNLARTPQINQNKSPMPGSEISNLSTKESDNLLSSNCENKELELSEEKSKLSSSQESLTSSKCNDGDDDDELQKKIAQLRKSISIQRVTSSAPKQMPKEVPVVQPPPEAQVKPLQKSLQQKVDPLAQSTMQQHSPSQQPKQSSQPQVKPLTSEELLPDLINNPSFHDTLESITSAYKSSGPHDDANDDEDEDEEESIDHEFSEDDETEDKDNKLNEPEQSESSDIAYVSEEPMDQNSPTQKSKTQDYNNTGSYGNYYNYNMPHYQPPPPPQNYQGYPPQPHTSHYDPMAYPQPQQPYNYGYQGYQQPQYTGTPQPGYDYNNPHISHPPPVYSGYPPYPQQFQSPHPPQVFYPSPHPGQSQPQPQQQFQDYSGYQNSNNQYYHGS